MRLTFADAIFWVAVVCCAVAQVAILRSVFAARGPAAGGPGAGSVMPPMRRGLEVLWAVVPALGLALVLALTWRAIRPDPAVAPPAAETILS